MVVYMIEEKKNEDFNFSKDKDIIASGVIPGAVDNTSETSQMDRQRDGKS